MASYLNAEKYKIHQEEVNVFISQILVGLYATGYKVYVVRKFTD